MYSLGVLILLMCRYFPNEMKSDQFDKLKKTESSYEQFMVALLNSTQTITEPLKKKLIKIAEICLSFIPEKRLSAKELKGLLKNLVNKNLEEISNEYSEIIHARNPIDASNVSASNYNENEIKKIREEFSIIKKEKEKINNKLREENSNLVNELYLQDEEIEKLKFEEENLKSLLIKSDLEVEKLQKLLLMEEPENSGENLSSHKVEQENTFSNEQTNMKELLEQVQVFEKDNEDIKKKINEYEEQIKVGSERIASLEKYEKIYEEMELEFNTIKKQLKEEKMDEFENCKSYPELVGMLFETLKRIKEDSSNEKIRYVEGIQYSENSTYNGPVNELNQPDGAGTLIFKEPYKRIIAEFENGKCKNDIGFSVNEEETYCFGKFQNGIFESICLIFYEYPKYQGKRYYCGEITNNMLNGKGKYVYSEVEYYEGDWKDNRREGIGKYVNPDGAYYEGEWRNNNKEGKGKYYVVKLEQVEEIYEGFWENDQRQGKFLITNSRNETSYRNYKDDSTI